MIKGRTMSFDEYYDSVFNKTGVTSHTLSNGEWQHHSYKNDKFSIQIKSIELFDGFRLDFGTYNGDFTDFVRETPRTEILHFGYCVSGYYEGIIDNKIPINIGASDMWACSMLNSTQNNKICVCECISFNIDIHRAKGDIGKFLKHCDIIYIHDGVVCNPVIYSAQNHIISLFSKLHCHNSDILRLVALELLMTLNVIVHEMPRKWREENYCKEIYSMIQKHCDRDLSLDYFAKMYDVSVAKLTRDFVKTYNTSIYQSIKQCRMQKAFYLLKKGDKTITQIASEVGYINVSAFCKNFKQCFGVSPTKA